MPYHNLITAIITPRETNRYTVHRHNAMLKQIRQNKRNVIYKASKCSHTHWNMLVSWILLKRGRNVERLLYCFVFPAIHYLYTLILCRVVGDGASLSSHWANSQPGQFITGLTHENRQAFALTPTGNLESQIHFLT